MKKYYFIIVLQLFIHVVQAQQIDTLRNISKNISLIAPKYTGSNQWGYYLGQNHLYRQQFAEKYNINGKGSITGVVTHLTGSFAHPNNIVEFNVYAVGANKLPGIRLNTFSVLYKDLDLTGKAFSITFPYPVEVVDSFYVSFNVDDYLHGGYDGDTLGLYCGIDNSRDNLDLKNFGRNAVQAHNHSREDWKDFYSQNFTPIATHFALFPIIQYNPTGTDDAFANKSGLKLIAYPNPARDYTQLEFELKTSSHVIIDLHDIHGQAIKNISLGKIEIGKNLVKIDLTGIPTGSYLMQVKTEQTVLTSKITIE